MGGTAPDAVSVMANSAAWVACVSTVGVRSETSGFGVSANTGVFVNTGVLAPIRVLVGIGVNVGKAVLVGAGVSVASLTGVASLMGVARSAVGAWVETVSPAVSS